MLYRCRLYTRDGDEDGEAHYAVPISGMSALPPGRRATRHLRGSAR